MGFGDQSLMHFKHFKYPSAAMNQNQRPSYFKLVTESIFSLSRPNELNTFLGSFFTTLSG